MHHKSRKTLQTIQPSADISNPVDGTNMVLVGGKKESKTNEKPRTSVKSVITPGKENVSTVRRSKRINDPSGVDTKAVAAKMVKNSGLSSQSQKPVKKTRKCKKGCSAPVKKTTNSEQLNVLPAPSTSACIEDLSKLVSDAEVFENESTNTVVPSIKENASLCPEQTTLLASRGNVTVFSEVDETYLLTDETVPLEYWRDLAEERRIALEKVLHENELLIDQLAVLETENSQLRNLVKDAENMASVLKGILQ